MFLRILRKESRVKILRIKFKELEREDSDTKSHTELITYNIELLNIELITYNIKLKTKNKKLKIIIRIKHIYMYL